MLLQIYFATSYYGGVMPTRMRMCLCLHAIVSNEEDSPSQRDPCMFIDEQKICMQLAPVDVIV